MTSPTVPRSLSASPARAYVPVTELIRTRLPELSPSQRRVGRAVLADPSVVARLSAEELARETQVSQATVTRFCQAVGLPGYQSLLLRIAQEGGPRGSAAEEEPHGRDVEVAPDDDYDAVLRSLLGTHVRGLRQAAQLVDPDEVDRAALALRRARRIDVYAYGGSGVAAAELELVLFGLGLVVRAWPESHQAQTSAALLTCDDVAVAISASGQTREAHDALRQARERGARTIAITRDPRSRIGRLGDVHLTASPGPTPTRVSELATRPAQLLVVHLLAVRLMQQDHERASTSLALTSHVAAHHRLSRRSRQR